MKAPIPVGDPVCAPLDERAPRGPVHPHAPEGSVVKVPPIRPTPSQQVEATPYLETWHQGDDLWGLLTYTVVRMYTQGMNEDLAQQKHSAFQ